MSLGDLSRSPWTRCSELLRDAAVFVDEDSAELLHWAGGVAVLPPCTGVYDVYTPLSTVARDAIVKSMFSKVVFVVSTYLSGKCSQRMSALLSELQPLTCHVLCSQSEQCHALHLPLTSDPAAPYSHYGEFQALIRKWINRESGVRVSVQHLPVFHSEVCLGLIITPPFAGLFPPLYQTLLQEFKQAPSIEKLSHELQTQIKSFVSGMDMFLGQIDAKEEIFSFGYFSAMISKELCVLPEAVARRKSSSQRCSLLLVDRTLDLTAPTCHCSPEEALGDRLLAFPPLAHGCSDVAVDLTPLTEGPHKSLIAGSLAQPLNKMALQLLKTLMTSRQKECLMELSRLLLEAIAKEHLDIKLTRKLGRPSAQQLKGFLEQFKGHPQAVVAQHSLLQLACAVLQSLEGERHAHWELLSSIEKVLMVALSEGSDGGEGGSVAGQLCEVVGGREELGVCELLGVAVSLYALAGAAAVGSSDKEQQLKEALAALLVKHRACDEEFTMLLGIMPEDSKTTVLEKLEPVFQRLHNLHHTSPLPTYDSLSPLPYCPLMKQLAQALFDPSASLSSSVFQHHPQPQAGLLQSGFSYLKSQPRPEQSPRLVVFVVGGVTCSEVKMLRDAVASHKSQIEIIVGGTRLQNSRNITTQVLCADHLEPS